MSVGWWRHRLICNVHQIWRRYCLLLWLQLIIVIALMRWLHQCIGVWTLVIWIWRESPATRVGMHAPGHPYSFAPNADTSAHSHNSSPCFERTYCFSLNLIVGELRETLFFSFRFKIGLRRANHQMSVAIYYSPCRTKCLQTIIGVRISAHVDTNGKMHRMPWGMNSIRDFERRITHFAHLFAFWIESVRLVNAKYQRWLHENQHIWVTVRRWC